VYSLRSGPAQGGNSYTFKVLSEKRRNATSRPSGDQVKQQSFGFLVSPQRFFAADKGRVNSGVLLSAELEEGHLIAVR